MPQEPPARHFFDQPRELLERRAAPRRSRWRSDPRIAAFLDQGLAQLNGGGERLLVALEDAGEQEAIAQLVALRSTDLFRALCVASNFNTTEVAAVTALVLHLNGGGR